MNKHWLDQPGRLKNLLGHQNPPRIDAETILKLVKLKNKLTGANRTVYEESTIAEDTKEQYA